MSTGDESPIPVDLLATPASADTSASVEATDVPDSDADPGQAAGRKFGRRRSVGLVLLGAGVLILIMAGWVGFRAYQAYNHLRNAQNVVLQMQDEFKHHGISRPAQLVSLADDLAGESGDAQSATADPLYGLATHVPWLGANLEAVRQLSNAVDGIAQTMPAAAGLASRLDAAHILPHAGAIDISVVRDSAAALERTDAAIQQALTELSGVDRSHLVGPVSKAVDLMQTKLAQVSPLTSAGSKLGRLVVPMLGSQGPRNYLLVFQNLAEPRATGGIFGSYVLIHLDQGHITIGNQGAASREIGDLSAPISPVPPEVAALYTDRIATFPTDVNFTPDFPSAASTFRQMFMSRTGQQVDGVLAIDPSVVSVLLLGRPPIPLGNGLEMTAQNVTEVLLSDVYKLFPTSADAASRDVYLAAATAKAFQTITSGGGDLRPIVSGIKDMVDVRRVLVWSAHPDEESLIMTTAVSGRLPDDPVAAPSVGVFLNDGTGAKLGYYLDGKTRLAAGSCVPGGHELKLSVDLAYEAPKTGLSEYVLGSSRNSVPYRLRTNVMVFAPTGGRVEAVTVNGKSVPVLRGVDHGRNVAVVTVDQMPGDTTTVYATLVALDPGNGTANVHPRLITTPGPRPWDNQATDYTACHV